MREDQANQSDKSWQRKKHTHHRQSGLMVIEERDVEQGYSWLKIESKNFILAVAASSSCIRECRSTYEQSLAFVEV